MIGPGAFASFLDVLFRHVFGSRELVLVGYPIQFRVSTELFGGVCGTLVLVGVFGLVSSYLSASRTSWRGEELVGSGHSGCAAETK